MQLFKEGKRELECYLIKTRVLSNLSLEIYRATSSEEEYIPDTAEGNWLGLWLNCAADKLSVTSLIVIKRLAVLGQVDKLVLYSEV